MRVFSLSWILFYLAVLSEGVSTRFAAKPTAS